MTVSTEHAISHFDGTSIYKRSDADCILSSTERRLSLINPQSLPIAGLRSISKDGEYPTNEDVPREVLSFEQCPLSIFDLDEVIWPHIWAVVRAVGEATGKQITMEYYRKFCNTRKIPEWKDDPDIMRVHDQIVWGEHPDFYPYVNEAYFEAIRTLRAVERMGHGFFYQTSRPPKVLEATLRTIDWNGMPRNVEQNGRLDPFCDGELKNGTVYCGDGLPMLVDRTSEPKRDVLEHWLKNLRGKGWRGEMVVVDDLQIPFEGLLKRQEIIGVALQGDVNASIAPLPGELRVDSWKEISDILMQVHERAVSSESSPYRIFEHQGRRLIVDKNEAGTGVFNLNTISKSAWRWEDMDAHSGVQEDFKQISG